MTNRLFAAFLLLTSVTVAGCDRTEKKTTAKEAPAKVEKLPQETELSVVHLTPRAVERLGITFAKVERRGIERTRTLGGEVIIPPGESAIVTAPVTATLQSPRNAEVPKPGSHVSKGQLVFELMPLLTPERFVPTPAERAQMANAKATLVSLQITADGDVKQSQEEVTAAKIALNRAEQLLKDRAGSERALDDATAQLAIADSRLQAALQRKQVLDQLTSDMDKGVVSPIPIASPTDGIVRTLPVALGQMVSAGTTLFEVVNLETVWIRVPVYVGQLDELNLDADATISDMGEQGPAAHVMARPVSAPPSADPLASTADLFFSVDNRDGQFRPGERISVTLAANGEQDSLVVPSKSILRDIYGGTWVYLRGEENSFRRARVGLKYLRADFAVLETGPPEGTEVVVDGAAELFGTEFGTGK